MDVRILNDYESLIRIHLKSEAEVELFLSTANKIGLQLKSLACGKIPEKDRPYEDVQEPEPLVIRVHKPYPKPKKEIDQTGSEQPAMNEQFIVNEFTKFSEFLREVSRAYAFQRMSRIENGTLVMSPFNESSQKWAESIKQMLAQHEIKEVVIR
jgi:hypothetical protein